MEKIKFRQPIFANGEFKDFHYWGDVEDDFFSRQAKNLDQIIANLTGVLEELEKIKEARNVD